MTTAIPYKKKVVKAFMNKDDFFRKSNGKFSVEYLAGKLDKNNKFLKFEPESGKFQSYDSGNDLVFTEKARDVSFFKVYRAEVGSNVRTNEGCTGTDQGKSSGTQIEESREVSRREPRRKRGRDQLVLQRNDVEEVDSDSDGDIELDDDEPVEEEQGSPDLSFNSSQLPEQLSFQDVVEKLDKKKYGPTGKVQTNLDSFKLTTTQMGKKLPENTTSTKNTVSSVERHPVVVMKGAKKLRK